MLLNDRPNRRELLAGAAAVAGIAALPATAAPEPAAALLDRIAEEFLRLYPNQASSLGIDTGKRAALRGQLPDRSPAGQAKLRAAVAGWRRELDALPAAARGGVDVAVAQASFADAAEGLAFPYGDVDVGGWRNSPYVVIQNVGAFIDVPQLLELSHKLETRADADAYLARLEGFAAMLDGETARVRAATAAGAIPPDFLLDKTLAQLGTAGAGDPAGWSYVRHLAAKFPDRGAAATRVAAERVRPALARQAEAIRAQRALAKSDAGAWHLPDGEHYYRWALAAATTTKRTPEEIHRQGLDELARYQAEMDRLLRPLGYTQGSVGARMAALGKDPRFLFPDSDAGRQQIIAFLRQRIDGVRALLPRAFSHPAKGFVEVVRIPPAEEPGAAGAYGGPGSIDGTVPGRLRINLATTARWPRYALPTLAYHEAIPGHVFQGEYSFRLPLIRSLLSFSAYGEGWALYSEQLADELGVYADNPVDRLGYLQSMAFRACRLVVDTGIHAKRWTREQAARWLAEQNGQEASEVATEIDRYCAWPGQACAYKVGHSEIVRLREATRVRLGTRFDGRTYNDAVVGVGSVPMSVLAEVAGRIA